MERNRLGLAIKELCLKKGIKQIELAKSIGMSNTSLSQIVTGKAKPRQGNFLKLLQALSNSPADEQLLINAFGHIEEMAPDEPSNLEWSIPDTEIDRAMRHLEVKAMSVGFQQETKKTLTELGFAFEHPYRKGNFVCDFFLSGNPSIGIICKFNVNQDWDRTIATVKILRDELLVEHVIILVPYVNDSAKEALPKIETFSGIVIATSELKQTINRFRLP